MKHLRGVSTLYKISYLSIQYNHPHTPKKLNRKAIPKWWANYSTIFEQIWIMCIIKIQGKLFSNDESTTYPYPNIFEHYHYVYNTIQCDNEIKET